MKTREQTITDLEALRDVTFAIGVEALKEYLRMDLKIDPERDDDPRISTLSTGIFVRAKTPEGHFEAADIALLDTKSLNVWLQSLDRPAVNNLVLRLLGHG